MVLRNESLSVKITFEAKSASFFDRKIWLNNPQNLSLQPLFQSGIGMNLTYCVNQSNNSAYRF
jgi:hypothetical protein